MHYVIVCLDWILIACINNLSILPQSRNTEDIIPDHLTQNKYEKALYNFFILKYIKQLKIEMDFYLFSKLDFVTSWQVIFRIQQAAGWTWWRLFQQLPGLIFKGFILSLPFLRKTK